MSVIFRCKADCPLILEKMQKMPKAEGRFVPYLGPGDDDQDILAIRLKMPMDGFDEESQPCGNSEFNNAPEHRKLGYCFTGCARNEME